MEKLFLGFMVLLLLPVILGVGALYFVFWETARPLAVLLLVALVLGVLPWLLRVNQIVAHLAAIRDHLAADPAEKKAILVKCAACGRLVAPELISKLDSGQEICTDCREALK